MSKDLRAMRPKNTNISLLEYHTTSSSTNQTPKRSDFSIQFNPNIISTPIKYTVSATSEWEAHFEKHESNKSYVSASARKIQDAWSSRQASKIPRTPKVRQYIKALQANRQPEVDKENLGQKGQYGLEQQSRLYSNTKYTDSPTNQDTSFNQDFQQTPNKRTIAVAIGTPRSVEKRIRKSSSQRRSFGNRRRSLGREAGSLVFSGTENSKTVFIEADKLGGKHSNNRYSNTGANDQQYRQNSWLDEDISFSKIPRYSPRDELRALSRVINKEKRREERLEKIRQQLLRETEEEEIRKNQQENNDKKDYNTLSNNPPNDDAPNTRSVSRKRKSDTELISSPVTRKNRDSLPEKEKELLRAQELRRKLSNSSQISSDPLTSQTLFDEVMATPTPSIPNGSFRRSPANSKEFGVGLDDVSPSQEKSKHLDISREIEIQRDVQSRLSFSNSRLSEGFPEFNTTQNYDEEISTKRKSFAASAILDELIYGEKNGMSMGSNLDLTTKKNDDKFVIEIDDNLEIPEDFDVDIGNSIDTNFNSSSLMQHEKIENSNSEESHNKDDENLDSLEDFRQLRDRMIYENQTDDDLDLQGAGIEYDNEQNLQNAEDENENEFDHLGLDLGLDENPEGFLPTENEAFLNNISEDENNESANANALNITLSALELESTNASQSLSQQPSRSGTRITHSGRRKAPPCTIPQGLIKDLASSMIKSKRKLEIGALHRIMEITENFFDQVGADLSAYAHHNKRKRVEVSDVRLMMDRQFELTNNQKFDFGTGDFESNWDKNFNINEKENGRPLRDNTNTRNRNNSYYRSRKRHREFGIALHQHQRNLKEITDLNNTYIENACLKYLPQESVDEITRALKSVDTDLKQKAEAKSRIVQGVILEDQSEEDSATEINESE